MKATIPTGRLMKKTQRQFEILGQPAAKRWPQDRSQHDARAPDGHGLAVAFPRVDVEQKGLRQGYDRRAEHALHQAEKHDGFEAPRQPAQHGKDGKADDRRQEQFLAAEPVCQPAGDRRHDCRCNDIGRQHPVDIVRGGAEIAGHRRQRDIGNRRIERLHDRRQHERNGDQAAMRGIDGIHEGCVAHSMRPIWQFRQLRPAAHPARR